MSKTHWEFNFNIKKPSPQAVKIFTKSLILLIVWGTLPLLGYYIGFSGAKTKYNTGTDPVTITVPGEAVTFEEDGNVTFVPAIKEGTAEDYAARFLKETHIINKLPKNYQMDYWETLAIADVYCGNKNADIMSLENATLLLWWVFMKSDKPNDKTHNGGEAARQCILYIGKNWPGVHMTEDWGGKHTKAIYEMARDWKTLQ